MIETNRVSAAAEAEATDALARLARVEENLALMQVEVEERLHRLEANMAWARAG